MAKTSTRAVKSNSKRTASAAHDAGRMTEPLERDVERGASGTPNFGGYITGEDYNPKLDGVAALKVYDEMRRSDAQVHASLDVLKLPLKSATWEIQAPDNATPQEQEVADFCQSALLDEGAMRDPWDFTLSHMLLMLDFGCIPFEKVFTLGEDKRIRYARLAPRLPQTLWRFEVAEDGQLSTLVQYAAKGSSGNFQELTIDAPYLAHFTHDREGDNYFGRSVLRSAYPHWFYKKDAYRIAGIRLHRFGVGIPKASIDTTKMPSNSTDELNKIETTLKGIVAHEKAYIRSPDWVTWDILVPQGGAGGDKTIIEVIEHHNLMIARNVLATFISEGGDGLNSSRTRSLLDFFISALYTLAANICGTANRSILKPLCDLNFAMSAGLRYPKLVANDVADTDIKQLTENIKNLAPEGFITPSDDDEDALRKLMGLPPMEASKRGQERKREAAVTPPGAPPTPEPPAPAPKKPAPKALSLRHTTAGKTFELHGRIYARQPTDLEERILSLTEVPDMLDLETQALAGALVNIRRRQLQKLSEQIAAKDARTSTGAFTDIRPGSFSVPLKADVQRAIKATLLRSAEFGARQVRLEFHRQGMQVSLAGVESILDQAFSLAGDPSAAASKQTLQSALTTSAKVTTERETDAWFNRILETGVRLRRAGAQGETLATSIVTTLTPELETGTSRTAKGEVNEGFALGRATEAGTRETEIEVVEYSCLLDASSCTPCADIDGEQFAYGSDRYYATMPPYKDCDGNKGSPDACRCVHLYLFKASGK